VDGIKRRLSEFKTDRRKVVRLSREDLVKMNYLDPERQFPLVIEPQTADFDLVAWAENNREFIELKLLGRGARLFRGFKVEMISQFEQLARAISGEL
jgi:hypothetical protein